MVVVILLATPCLRPLFQRVNMFIVWILCRIFCLDIFMPIFAVPWQAMSCIDMAKRFGSIKYIFNSFNCIQRNDQRPSQKNAYLRQQNGWPIQKWKCALLLTPFCHAEFKVLMNIQWTCHFLWTALNRFDKTKLSRFEMCFESGPIGNPYGAIIVPECNGHQYTTKNWRCYEWLAMKEHWMNDR